jgi:hypothetical protein
MVIKQVKNFEDQVFWSTNCIDKLPNYQNTYSNIPESILKTSVVDIMFVRYIEKKNIKYSIHCDWRDS